MFVLTWTQIDSSYLTVVLALITHHKWLVSSTSCVSSRHYHMHPISGSNQEYDAPRKTTGLCLGSGVLHEAAVLQLDGDNNQS